MVESASYYDDGYRVTRDGVPCKVFIKRSPELSRQIAMIKLASEAGAGLELENAPGFCFNPLDKGPQAINPRGALPVPKTSEIMKDYYKGGYRRIIKGIPCRLEHHPRNHKMNHWAGTAPIPDGNGQSWERRAKDFAHALEKCRHALEGEYYFPFTDSIDDAEEWPLAA